MTEPGNSACVNNGERLDKAYREANRLIVMAGILLAGAGIVRHAPEMKALSAAIRAVNHGRDLVRTGVSPDAKKESDRAKPTAFGRRLRRALP
jgi:hypothetical protein